MPLSYHPEFTKEIREVVEYYDHETGRRAVGDRLFREAENFIGKIDSNVSQFHYLDGYFPLRIANLKKFPYNILYYQKNTGARLIVFRHNKRHPDYGTRRR